MTTISIMPAAAKPGTRLFRTYVDTPLGQVHCRVAEPATVRHPPLLCLHMSPKSGWVYEPVLAQLGADRLIVAPDTPGFGMSDRPQSPPDLQDYTDVLAGVAASFAPAMAWDVLGYHTGSLIATDMALRHGQAVHRLALISAPLLTPGEIAEFVRLGLGTPRVWDAAGDSLLALWRLVLRWRVEGGALSVCARSLADTLLAGDYGWWGHRAAFAFDFEAALKAVRHPAVILNPGDDLSDATRRARTLRPDIPIVEKPDWAHGFMHEFADQASATFAAMLTEGP